MGRFISKRKGIPVLIIIGILSMITFYYLFGLDMLLRYLLGAVMFATITVSMINWLSGKFGKLKIKVRK